MRRNADRPLTERSVNVALHQTRVKLPNARTLDRQNPGVVISIGRECRLIAGALKFIGQSRKGHLNDAPHMMLPALLEYRQTRFGKPNREERIGADFPAAAIFKDGLVPILEIMESVSPVHTKPTGFEGLAFPHWSAGDVKEARAGLAEQPLLSPTGEGVDLCLFDIQRNRPDALDCIDQNEAALCMTERGNFFEVIAVAVEVLD